MSWEPGGLSGVKGTIEEVHKRMGLTFLKVVLVIGLICFILWALNQFKVVDVQTMLVQAASYVPGWGDLADNYNLGKNRNGLLKQREIAVANQEKDLKDAQSKLKDDQERFKEEKYQWEKDHPLTVKTTPVPYLRDAFGKPKTLTTEESKVQEYLSMVGNMKPKQAAAVIQKLPEATVFQIFDQLRPNQVTKIMENLPEDYLAKLTQDRLNKYRNP
jgi:flagellar motility protein MotE (MotC chaperone)